MFSVPDSRRVLEAGRKFGLAPRLHADEFVDSGGAELAAELGALGTAPSGVAAPRRPGLPSGAITPASIAAVLGALIPENAIIVDESVTTGREFFPETAGERKGIFEALVRKNKLSVAPGVAFDDAANRASFPLEERLKETDGALAALASSLAPAASKSNVLSERCTSRLK